MATVFISLFFMVIGINSAFSQTAFPIDRAADIYFRYELEIPAFEDDQKELKLWVPYPIDTDFQKVIRFSVQSPWSGELIQEEKHGNKFLFFKHLTLKRPLKMAFHYRLSRYPHTIFKKKDEAKDEKTLPEREKSQTTVEEKLPEKPLEISKEPEPFYKLYEKLKSVPKENLDTAEENNEKTSACVESLRDFKKGLDPSLREKFKLFFGFRLSENLRDVLKRPACWAMVQEDEKWIPMDGVFGEMPANRVTLFQGENFLPAPSHETPREVLFYPYAELEGSEFTDFTVQWHFTRIKTYPYPQPL